MPALLVSFPAFRPSCESTYPGRGKFARDYSNPYASVRSTRPKVAYAAKLFCLSQLARASSVNEEPGYLDAT